MLNSVSFGNNYNFNDYNSRQHSNSSYGSRTERPLDDTYHFEHKKPQQTKRPQTTSQARKPQNANKKRGSYLTPLQKIGLALGLFGAGAASVGVPVAVSNYQPKPEVAAYYGEITDPEQIGYIASLYGTSEEIILDYNGYDTAEEAVGADGLKIAKEYKPFDERLAELQSKMFDADLSETEKAELQTEIDYMIEKMQKQEESAIAYQDGKYIYFEIKKDIYAEEFKDIWGIKDESIRENNYDLIDDQGEFVDIHAEDGAHLVSYKDYTGAVLPQGVTIKVPVRDCGFAFMSYYAE